MMVEIASIKVDANTQVRAAINQDVVTAYAERMTAGDAFPPIVVFHDGNHHYLADGFHRTLAAIRNGLSEIPANVRKGTQEDALWFALGANRTNGAHLTATDKRHAILLALKTWPDYSAGKLADQVGVSQDYVSQLRAQVKDTFDLPNRVTGKDGKSYPASRQIGVPR